MPFITDILILIKPRIVVLLTITCVAAMLVAAKGNSSLISLPLVLITALGLTLSAGGANMVNMWFDRDIDKLMRRTRNRPLVKGSMQPRTVLALGIVFGLVGFGVLWAGVNFLTACMAASGYLFYVFIYTMLLKRHTVQNIVIGGAAGAFPPLVGWAAVQNDILHPLPWSMFAVIFLWTPPHFWSLALKVNADYTAAKIPMMPVVKGVDYTKVEIIRYMLILLPITLIPALYPPLGVGYALCALGLGLWWLRATVHLLYAQGAAQVEEKAERSFIISLYYLAALFIAMVGDAWI